MSEGPDDGPVDETEGRPVLMGLLALVGVGAAVGLVLGGVALVGTRALGLDESAGAAQRTSSPSLYLPLPTDTESPEGPVVTIGGDAAPTLPTPTGDPSNQQLADDINLSVATSQVSPGEEVDLTGTYGVEGARLTVQRLEGTSWEDFADGDVVATVSDGQFGTYVRTSRTGEMQFRVYDDEAEKASNAVTVTVG